jgi:acetyl/propionyl-CoA carboxylase alpha subunit
MRIGLRYNGCHLTVDLRREGNAYRATMEDGDKIVRAEFLDDHTLLLEIDGLRTHLDVVRQGDSFFVALGGEIYTFFKDHGVAPGQQVGSLASPEIVAPMPGKIVRTFVKPGDHVAAGEALFILEAMKMENRLIADADGIIESVQVVAGDLVDGGQVLAVISYFSSEQTP